jgi:hypothetical protein
MTEGGQITSGDRESVPQGTTRNFAEKVMPEYGGS